MKPLLVLIRDEDPERSRQIATILRQAGHEVDVAPNAAGVEPSRGSYDLVVLDPNSPRIDAGAGPEAPGPLHEAERRHLALVLRHTSGNKRKAAHLLGISRSTLLNKVRKYGLDR